ncbi:MAG: sulfatase, partial [Verrucomicrobiota bacterium]
MKSTRIFTALILSSMCCLNPLPAAEKPNIVFLLADDMNRDTWGAYGGQDCKTPHIDQLAREGMRFDRAYCAVAMCAPFRQELYSGRSPWRTGTLPNHSKSKAGTRSIPHYLKPLGYRTALIGKSHIGPAEAYPFEKIKMEKTKRDGKENTRLVEGARTFIASCTEENQPFCLFVASSDSHMPFSSGDPSAYDAKSFTIPPYWLDTPELRETLVKYYAEITNFDQLVGRMRRMLEDRGVWKNTIFMVCSEQGTQLPFAKWTCYDNGLHTGLVAHWPGVIEPGSVAAELISTADITPTLVDAAGGNLKPDDCDGKSFLKTLKGESEVLHEYVFGAFTNCRIIDNRERVYPIRVIRNKKFSLIWNPNYQEITSNVSLSGVLLRLGLTEA